ncbi:Trp biosynthesis-associated membrane protein [Nocardiopsis ansamitocini]|uniref:Membrane protein (TIGR02234 family) n=1 Tax=Nocardiopsis ansamitocini TaxID=1670832 RepID=A0A9W6P2B7_9ACTN|nr:Trp biosynthesis-associated membrane protein [Nocardiopsis ansamitocini]GLU45929.1 hypothetical protein Nans01_02800 [Nocardiopsis ansamitocini]
MSVATVSSRRRPAGSGQYLLTLTATAAGAVLLLAATAQDWATARVDMGNGLAPILLDLPASQVSPLASALGWAAFASVVAVVATRGTGRRVVGLLVALLGVAGLAGVYTGTRSAALAATAERLATADGDLSAVRLVPLGPVVAATAALLLVVAGVLTLLRGAAWPVMGSRYDRHDAPAATRTDDPAELWKSLDSGADPTADPLPGPGTPDADAPGAVSNENAEPKER